MVFKVDDIVQFNELGIKTYKKGSLSQLLKGKYSVIAVDKQVEQNEMGIVVIDIGNGKSYGINNIYFKLDEVHFRNVKINKIINKKPLQ